MAVSEQQAVSPDLTAIGGEEPLSGLRFGVARSVGQVEEAWRLLYRAYVRVGFLKPNDHGIHTVPEAIGPHTAVVQGRIDSLTVSTISAIGDSPLGLPLDGVYRPELDALRGEDRRLIEIGLFADRRKDIDRTFYAMLELMRYTYWFGRYLGATDYLCGIPPRRARLYRRAFGFEPIGEEKIYSTVDGNPVRMLRVRADYILAHHAQHRGLDYFITRPVAFEEFDRRFRFEPDALERSPIPRYLAGKAGE